MKNKYSENQIQLLLDFYSLPAEKVAYNKKERDSIWNNLKIPKEVDIDTIKMHSLAMAHQVQEKIAEHHNLQSGVLSECVYSQALANLFKLDIFFVYDENPNVIPETLSLIISNLSLLPRYVYTNPSRTKFLIQAGGCTSFDCALFETESNRFYKIEFKENYAKSGEPDLPWYDESGFIQNLDSWLENYPEYNLMINEKRTVNIFENLGSNIGDFSYEAIDLVISNKSSKNRVADVVCTEGKNGHLVMLAQNDVPKFAKIEGEIRTAGRNHYNVQTPLFLRAVLNNLGATFSGDMVSIDKSKLALRKARGGGEKVSGYKINSVLFVYARDCTSDDNIVTFNLKVVRQIKPTIAAKMNFGNVNFNTLKEFYLGILR